MCSIDPMTLWTSAIAFSTFVYMIATIFILLSIQKQSKFLKSQLLLNKEIFEISIRPFVAPTVFHTVPDNDGGINVTIEIENTGSFPATHLVIDWDIFVNDMKQPSSFNKARPAILLPSNNICLPTSFNKNVFDALKTKESIMQVVINISYQGFTNKNYTTYLKTQYDPSIGINAYVPIDSSMN